MRTKFFETQGSEWRATLGCVTESRWDSIHWEFVNVRKHGWDPVSFVLNERAFKGLKTWKNLYLHVLDCLYEADTERFLGLPQEKRFISRRGNPLFSKNSDDLRVAEQTAGNLMAEVNLSASSLIKIMGELLKYFGINPSSMKIYLREDRDAETH